MTTPPTPAAPPGPAEGYAGRRAARQDELQRLARRHGRLSAWRRLLLGALVVLIVLVEKEGLLARLAFIGAPALLLENLIRRRARIVGSMRKSHWLAGFCEQRLACVEERWAGTGKPGARYLELDHPAAADLDLFG